MRYPVGLPALFLLLAACGGGPSGPEAPAGYYVTARINGVPLHADENTIDASMNTAATPGRLSFQAGSQAAPPGQLSLSLGYVSGPGAYPAGVDVEHIRGSHIAQYAGGVRSTGWNGAAGMVTILSIDQTSMRGTFSGTLATGTIPGVVEVTEGQFRVPLNPGFRLAGPTDHPSMLRLSTESHQWLAGLVVALRSDDGTITFEGLAGANWYRILLEDVTVPGEYAIAYSSSPRRVVLLQSEFLDGNWGGHAGDAGTVSITTLTADRIAGTITATLQPNRFGQQPRTFTLEFDSMLRPASGPSGLLGANPGL